MEIVLDKLTLNETLIDGSNIQVTIGFIFLAVTLSLIVFLTIFGNILVLLAIVFDSHLRLPAHYLMGSLAFADLLLGLLVLPFSSLKELLNNWPFGSVFCEIWLTIDVLCCTASIYLVLAISVDRYIGVTQSLRYITIVTKRRIFSIIVIIWSISLVISLVPFLPIGWKKKNSHGLCEVNDQIEYAIFSSLTSFYIPLVAILISYFRIYKEARKQAKKLLSVTKNYLINGGHANDAQDKHSIVKFNGEHVQLVNTYYKNNTYSTKGDDLKQKKAIKHNSNSITGLFVKFKKEQKAAKTLAIVVGCFILCWMPFFVLLPIISFCKSCHVSDTVFKVFFWLGYCNSLMNPVIYAFSSPEFRKAYKRIIHCNLYYRDGTN